MARLWRGLCFCLLLLLAFPPHALAKRSSEAIYTEPFDLAAGGTCLTRASQEGIVFCNPALLPLGGAYLRWLGLQTGFILDRDLAASGSSGLKDKTSGGASAVVEELFQHSLHFGQELTLSVLNKNVAVTVFDRIEADLEGSRYEAAGLPAIRLGLEAYAGGLVSVATQPTPYLSLGLTGKYLLMGEPELILPIADSNALNNTLSSGSALRDLVKYGKGVGFDAGIFLFKQGRFIDGSFAMKVDDVGSTVLSGGEANLPQSLHFGLGLALHGTKEVLHLSLDYRDALGAYEKEPRFKKVYVGSRLMLRKMFGVGLGLYQGIPTFGIRADLYLFKLGITAYGRELGLYPGDRQRNLVVLYTSIGF